MIFVNIVSLKNFYIRVSLVQEFGCIIMGSAFSYEDNSLKLRLIKNINCSDPMDLDDILFAIKQLREQIAERIFVIEQAIYLTEEAEKEVAILIRQDQYLEIIQNKPKIELASIFGKIENNCIVPEILQWYQEPKE